VDGPKQNELLLTNKIKENEQLKSQKFHRHAGLDKPAPYRDTGASSSVMLLELFWIALTLHYVPGFRRNDANELNNIKNINELVELWAHQMNQS